MKVRLWRNAFQRASKVSYVLPWQQASPRKWFPKQSSVCTAKNEGGLQLSNNKLLGGKFIFVFSVVWEDGNYLEVMSSKWGEKVRKKKKKIHHWKCLRCRTVLTPDTSVAYLQKDLISEPEKWTLYEKLGKTRNGSKAPSILPKIWIEL